MYTNTCIWNLERWYWWNHFQGSNRDSDTEIKLVDTVGEEEGGRNWENSMEICTLPYVKQIASGNLLCDDTGSSSQCSVTTYRGGMGREVSGEMRREGTYLYLIPGSMWMPGRGQHSMAKQLPSNPKKKKEQLFAGNFPGGPLVKTPCFHYWGHDFNSWSGN